jgi:putative transposase
MRKTRFSQGNLYHIYNRGVDKRDIFMNDNDRWRFLQGLFLFNDAETSQSLLWQLEREKGLINFKVIKDYFAQNKLIQHPIVKIMADCLMPNHFHLLVEEVSPGGISKFMHKLGTGYTNYFNKKYSRSGSLFQGTFKAAHIDNENYLQYLVAYINVINPGQLLDPNLKKEGVKNAQTIIDFAESYFWSTNKEYLQIRDSIIIDKGVLGNIFPSGQKYRDFVTNIIPQKNKFADVEEFLLE